MRTEHVLPGPTKQFAPGFPASETVAVSTFNGPGPTDTAFNIALLC